MSSVAFALTTILIWSTLTLFSAGVSHLPAFLSAGIALSLGGLVGIFRVRDWRIPPLTFALGVGGIFGYHALFFLALRHAPAVEVKGATFTELAVSEDRPGLWRAQCVIDV